MIGKENRQIVRRMTAQEHDGIIDAEESIALQMHEEGKTLREIGEILDVSHETARSRIRDAKVSCGHNDH